MSQPLHPAATDLRSPLPAEIAQWSTQAKLVGQGQMRFFGLKIYDIRLWATGEHVPSLNAQGFPVGALALELEYARALEGRLIAERSLVEMQRVGQFTEEQGKRWLQWMESAFPNVAMHDRLSGVFDGHELVQFYHNGRLTTQTRDKQFAELFFGIWLHPATSAPAVREKLLGLKP